MADLKAWNRMPSEVGLGEAEKVVLPIAGFRQQRLHGNVETFVAVINTRPVPMTPHPTGLGKQVHGYSGPPPDYGLRNNILWN
ncbi:predicted protein [Sclerotinia sclerotiorum 1980 UF-70]|uniref:Uncharacterized protein n=2 Tax=Sclerotinia sclerotiorum (strain ATCC 18683 / 1980 / Ss-1) TaxID=665079 RepID=A7EU57_SCLS1|nr:predicted protein [Sclerotinia sclerotiorum 1980 UF-70]APA15241.1 hypothetical protein sscle_14g100110 [Sclerotinia sclerotiorum 1980 UF-70]EDN92999.1 predicted protein [Sclerotinia sclerotiorum 1980 UF-70]